MEADTASESSWAAASSSSSLSTDWGGSFPCIGEAGIEHSDITNELSRSRKVEMFDQVHKEGDEEFNSSGTKTRAMDETRWKELPEELMIPILARLPVHSIFKFRSVCRKWNSLLHNPSFLEVYAKARCREPLFIVPTDGGYAVYNPVSKNWHLWPYQFFLSEASLRSPYLVLRSRRSSPSSSSAVPFWKLDSAGGLLLLEGYGDGGRSLFVANPLNKSQRQVPLVEELWKSLTSTILGMVMDKETDTFRILALVHGCPNDVYLYEFIGRRYIDEEELEEPLKFFLYDSRSNSWGRTGMWHGGVRQFFQSPALHKGVLYILSSDTDEEGYFTTCPPPGFHVYRVENEAWHELQAQIPFPLHFPHLFENRGQLFLGGGVTDKDGLVSVHVWQLDPEGENWVEVLRMPEDFVRKLSLPMEMHFRTKFSFAASGDYISVSSFSKKLGKSNTAVCNMCTNSWWLLPKNFLRKYAGRYLFEPRLDIFA